MDSQGSGKIEIREVIPKHESYYFCFRRMKVFSMKSNKFLKPIKRKGSEHSFFKLYQNGVGIELSVFEIIALIFDFKY